MTSRNFKSIWNCLSLIWNKQFLVFLFFLCLSASFWLFEVLNETTEQEIEVPIEIRGIPEDVVITSDLPEFTRATLRDKGVTLMGYHFGGIVRPIVLDWKSISNSKGHVRILPNELRRQLSAQLSQGTQIVSMRPDTLEFYYNYGLRKRVPVALKGNLQAAQGYEITHTRFLPDSVTVYASNEILDNIKAAYVKPEYLKNIADSTTLQLDIQRVRGVKFEPSRVKLQIFSDRLVEKRVKLSVQSQGFPAGKQLLPIPQEVEVAFYVPMSMYRSIDASAFTVSVHYKDLPTDGSTSCPVRVDKAPDGVIRVRTIPAAIEYVIEDTKN